MYKNGALFSRIKRNIMKLPHILSGSKRTLQEANNARDQGHPHIAAGLYKKYLAENPSKNQIWVQAGNAYKDCGKFSEALSCYENALAIAPNDSDIFLQRGHLFKLMGRRDEAIKNYQKSYLLDNNQNAFKELASLDESEIMIENNVPIQNNYPYIEGSSTIWFDVTDLLLYVKHNNTLSGIQRVVANLISYAHSGYIDNYRIVPVVPDYSNFAIKGSSINLLVQLVRLFDEPFLDRKMANRLIETIETSYVDVCPAEGDILTTAGAFWIYPHYDYVRELRKEGVRFCVFVHDLIQISNPEYCAPEARIEFQTQWIDILSVCDFILANSNFVAQDVRNYIENKVNFHVPVYPIPLPTELKSKSGNTNAVRRHLTTIAKENYVLCVSTLEIRKNHIYLIKVWEKLIRELGEENVPRLVFVGKWGWQIDELRSYLDENGYVDDWLFILNGLSDSELEFLYKNALFTAYPSFAEGFGLPIGESLVYGKPCVASNTTSMPEVGGRFVKYIDPFNVEDGYKVFREVIDNKSKLPQWEDDIRENFKVKTWHSFCSEYFAKMISVACDLREAPTPIHCYLPQGKIIKGGTKDLLRIADSSDSKIILFRAARDFGWHPMEAWGSWASARRARLVFDTPLSKDRRIKVFMNACCPPQSENPHVVINCAGEVKTQNLVDDPKFFSFFGKVGDGGRVVIDINSRGKYGPTGHRKCYVGLSAIGYADLDSSADRINLLEDITFYEKDI